VHHRTPFCAVVVDKNARNFNKINKNEKKLSGLSAESSAFADSILARAFFSDHPSSHHHQRRVSQLDPPPNEGAKSLPPELICL
jgi:hypothetical protein